MILKVKDLKDLSSIILPAVESSDLTALPETLELVASNGILNFSITNKEYLLDVSVPIDFNEKFEATVNATLFLKLISQTSTELIELSVKDNSLIIKGNGTYKLPLIFQDDVLFKIPRIIIDNIDSEFDIEGDLLFNILKYNTKQISTGILSRPVQKMYYVDNEGAITFTSGACVTKFNLDQPIQLLFNQRLVKLFKLFKGNKVHFILGHSNINNEFTQTKVKFEINNIKLTAIVSSDLDMINSVPIKAIRDRAYKKYLYSVSINTSKFNDSINRMKLFIGDGKSLISYIKLTFNNDSLILSDLDNVNMENVPYTSSSLNLNEPYTLAIDLTDLQAVLDTYLDSDLTLNFGDNQALVISRVFIKNIIPEVKID